MSKKRTSNKSKKSKKRKQHNKSKSGRRPMDENFQYIERRRRNNWLSRFSSFLTLVGAIGLVSALTILQRAKPLKPNVFTRLLNITVDSYWKSGLLQLSIYISIGVLVLCGIAIFLNTARKKRKGDKYNYAPIVVGVFTLLFIAYVVIRYRQFFRL